MDLCSDGHDEIVYTCKGVFGGYDCPLCAAKKEIDEWEKEGSERDEKISELEYRIKELEDK